MKGILLDTDYTAKDKKTLSFPLGEFTVQLHRQIVTVMKNYENSIKEKECSKRTNIREDPSLCWGK